MENSKQKLNQGYYPVIVLLLVCLISTALLALTNEATLAAREEQARQAELRSKQLVFPQADDFKADELPDGSPTGVQSLDLAYANEELIGYLINAAAKGYGGKVTLYLGIDKEGEIVGIDLPANNETPGLGQKVRDEKFRSNFLNNNAKHNFTLNSAQGDEVEVDAIAGATISSQAVVDAVNSALELYRDFLKE